MALARRELTLRSSGPAGQERSELRLSCAARWSKRPSSRAEYAPNAVLRAMRRVAREAFLPQQLREFAYEDCPLPIEEGQTISQPYIVAFMTEALALQGGERVLEIGTGSGYAAAVLAEIAGEVYTVERIGQLAEKAASTLADLGYANVHVLHGDGTKGWPEHAPYDGIIVAAGGPKIPDSLKEQLKIGGRLVIPVGRDPKVQELVRVTRISENEFRREDLADVRFVPLIGHEGWGVAEREPNARTTDAAAQGRAGSDIAASGRRILRTVRSIETADLDRSARAHRRCQGRASRRGDPRDFGILPHARPHHARADHAEGFPFRRHRRRLAGRCAGGSLRPTLGISALRVDGVCPLPSLDVAQQRGTRIRRLAARITMLP